MGSFPTPVSLRSSALPETTCGYLLQELQMIWDEVGEDQAERERVLLDLEQECLKAYRRKVDIANISRSHLHQKLAEAQAEFTHLLLSLGERSLPGRPEKMAGNLKEQLDSITPALREMQQRKEERMKQFRAVQGQIQAISAEIAGRSEFENLLSTIPVHEGDLSLKKLEEYQNELERLQIEKNYRIRRVDEKIDTIHKLSTIMGMDFSMMITKVHPTLNELCGISKNISNTILEKLDSTVKSLEEEKQKRLEKLSYLAKSLTNLWNLMDTPHEDRALSAHVMGLLSRSPEQVSDPGSLTLNLLQQAQAEVKRLDQLKASKMKELFMKKQHELEEICRGAHMEIPSRSEMDRILNLINSGNMDHTDPLMTMDERISRVREEALSRIAIMEKVEKWMIARDEERWLEEYNRDENKYSVSRGAYKNLKRAERAWVTISKISALVELIIEKTKSWEEERKKVFLFDEVPLLAMLEEYSILRREKEEEKQKQKETKKAQGPVGVNSENLSKARPGTSSRRLSNRSLNGGLWTGTPPNGRLSLNNQNISMNSSGFYSATPISSDMKERRKARTIPRTNLVSSLRDETASVVSTRSGPLSP
ncbi:hypothetical protein MLD38_009422 [Melastoma candidum]|uniref:Uncharacterized protein n=1 Tax=Melastoma candidum TaxID=119954 RepID=A0ACB9RX63_9MYRT|nr:hypothetical protein MLD38_009422 [Melastoma candidum]